MDRTHPVRGADFAQFAEAATLDEFAPSVRLVGREDEDSPIAVRYQYYIAGPAAADEAFLKAPFRLVRRGARAEDESEFARNCRQYRWEVEIFTPIASIVYLYDLAYRVAGQIPQLSTPQILTHWERTGRVVTDMRRTGRYYTRPIEALMIPLLEMAPSHSPSPGEYPRITALFPEFDRANPAVEPDAVPSFGYEERQFDLDAPPHVSPFEEHSALEGDSG
jgi:hypothetical protein